MNGENLIKELTISKADLVRTCLSIGLPVFGLDILQREFSSDEVARVQQKIGSVQQVDPALGSKSKKKPKTKRNIQKTPRYFAHEFMIDVEEVFALAKSFGFAIRNENYRLTERQVAVLEEQLIEREDSGLIELRLKNLEVEENSEFASALKAALESRDSSKGVKSKNSSIGTAYVATSKRLKLVADEKGVTEELLAELCVAVGIPVETAKKSLKIDVQHLDQVNKVVDVFNEVQQYKSAKEKVRISKIAKLFEVQAKDVRELCEANDVPVISERFITNDSEAIILVLLQLRSVQGDEIVRVAPSPVTEKKNSNKTSSVDYSGLSLTRQEVHEYDFSKSIMQEVDFSYSKLSDLSFSGSQLNDSVFIQVNIKNSNFVYANLYGAVFEVVDGENIDFKNTKLVKASFRKAKLKNCSFSGADLSQCNFQDAELENCDFSGAVIADTKWIDGELVQSCEDLVMYGTK
jgi:uncharacterized protein YjbI with pentapeptide repeats